MEHTDKDSAAEWTAADLERDRSWVFEVDPKTRNYLADLAKYAYDQDRALLDYRRDDFDFGPACPLIARAMEEALHGRGLAIVRGLPRQGLSEKEFELLNWAIGLHAGVARPQGRATQYISQVRNIGTDYRSASGRGFSSDAKLDFHADGADLATLGCYNTAKSGGQSMISSSLTARKMLIAERPDLAEVACQKFYFSRQNEEAPDEEPAYGQPLFDTADGRVFCRWNRNRVQSAQKIEG
ncbi:MAG: TauD/TfdA family dioxygenase, partial [Hyphomicrobiaceae bacterium]